MGKVRYSVAAASKIDMICSYYDGAGPGISDRARKAIVSSIRLLEQHPLIGRPFRDSLHFREKVIEFGQGHFLALYRIDSDGSIVVTAIKHEREGSYDLADKE